VSAADVVAWLRSPEGEQWSRARALAADNPVTLEPVLWRARGPLRRDLDPCGSGPLPVRGGGDG
jgi:hypothetical protein